VGTYLGGKADPLTPEARTELFMCPTATARNNGTVLNYSANPNVCKEIAGPVGQVPASGVARTADVIVAADAIQYAPDGSAHAIFWGVLGSGGWPVYWNDGSPANGNMPIPVGPDQDGAIDVNDPAGSNFRYRHSGRISALFADSHVESIARGRVLDRNLYTIY